MPTITRNVIAHHENTDLVKVYLESGATIYHVVEKAEKGCLTRIFPTRQAAILFRPCFEAKPPRKAPKLTLPKSAYVKSK